MGWLMSCRRACVEGVDVLYGTNVFHFGSPRAVRNAPCLVCERMQRAQVIGGGVCPWMEDAGLTGGVQGFVKSIEDLAGMLPNIQFLYLSLNWGLMPPTASLDNGTISTTMDALLEHVDKVVHGMHTHGKLSGCRVALPTSCYGSLKWRATWKWIQSGAERTFEPEAIWRGISVDPVTAEVVGGANAVVSGVWSES